MGSSYATPTAQLFTPFRAQSSNVMSNFSANISSMRTRMDDDEIEDDDEENVDDNAV